MESLRAPQDLLGVGVFLTLKVDLAQVDIEIEVGRFGLHGLAEDFRPLADLAGVGECARVDQGDRGLLRILLVLLLRQVHRLVELAIQPVGVDHEKELPRVRLRVALDQLLVHGDRFLGLPHVLIRRGEVLLEDDAVRLLAVAVVPRRLAGLLQQAGEHLRGLFGTAPRFVAHPEIELGLDVPGVQLEGLLETFDRLRRLARPQPGAAELRQRERVPRSRGDDLLEDLRRLGELARLDQRRAQLPLHGHVVAGRLEDFPVERNRVLVPVELGVRRGEHHHRFRVFRLGAVDGLAQVFDRLLGVPGLVVVLGDLDVARIGVGAQRLELFVRGDRLLRLAQVEVGLAQREVGPFVVGRDLAHRLQLLDRLLHQLRIRRPPLQVRVDEGAQQPVGLRVLRIQARGHAAFLLRLTALPGAHEQPGQLDAKSRARFVQLDGLAHLAERLGEFLVLLVPFGQGEVVIALRSVLGHLRPELFVDVDRLPGLAFRLSGSLTLSREGQRRQ